MKKSRRNLIAVIAAILIWVAYWFGIQSLYFPIFSNVLNLHVSLDFLFAIYSLCITIAALIITVIWCVNVKDFSFLKLKKKRILYLYILPVVLTILLLRFGDGVGINSFLYAISMWSTTALAQDLVTFRFLQTFLEKRVNRKLVAIITGTVFFSGHLILGLGINTIFYAIGSILFSYLRYKTKNIYLLDVIHISFLLITPLL